MPPVNPSVLPWRAGQKHNLCVLGPEQTDELYFCMQSEVWLQHFIHGINSHVATAASLSHLRPWDELGSGTIDDEAGPLLLACEG